MYNDICLWLDRSVIDFQRSVTPHWFRNAISQKLGGKWVTECLSTRSFLSTLLYGIRREANYKIDVTKFQNSMGILIFNDLI